MSFQLVNPQEPNNITRVELRKRLLRDKLCRGLLKRRDRPDGRHGQRGKMRQHAIGRDMESVAPFLLWIHVPKKADASRHLQRARRPWVPPAGTKTASSIMSTSQYHSFSTPDVDRTRLGVHIGQIPGVRVLLDFLEVNDQQLESHWPLQGTIGQRSKDNIRQKE